MKITNDRLLTFFGIIFLTLGFTNLSAQTAQVSCATTENVAINAADLLVLENVPEIEEEKELFLKEYLPVTTTLYTSVLNAIVSSGYDSVLYTEKVAPFIARTQDEYGFYHYTALKEEELTLLGYLKCLDITKLQEALLKQKNDSLASKADLDTDNHLFIRLGIPLGMEKLNDHDFKNSSYSEELSDGTKINYYLFDKSVFTDEQSGSMSHDISEELWISVPKIEVSKTFAQTVSGDKNQELTIKKALTKEEDTIAKKNSKPNAALYGCERVYDLIQDVTIVLGSVAIGATIGTVVGFGLLAIGSALGCIGTEVILGSVFRNIIGELLAVASRWEALF